MITRAKALAALFVVLLGIHSVTAAIVDVTISNFSFSPPTITIKQGNTVRWTNQDPFGHTTTGGTSCTPNGMWDSPLLGQGQTYSFQFNATGTFPYFCRPHCSFMSGTVIVQSANASPTVSLTSPTNGSIFSVGADITITASAADSDGTVTQVAFLDGNRTLAVVKQSTYAHAG